jgi:hypothetical protein
MKSVQIKPSNQGHGKISYMMEANADEWNLIKEACDILKCKTPRIKEFCPVRNRLKNIVRIIRLNIPASKKRLLYDTTSPNPFND